ncbi:hypothetical protein V8E54_007112 [Elaphomyces granulatus]
MSSDCVTVGLSGGLEAARDIQQAAMNRNVDEAEQPRKLRPILPRPTPFVSALIPTQTVCSGCHCRKSWDSDRYRTCDDCRRRQRLDTTTPSFHCSLNLKLRSICLCFDLVSVSSE